MKPKKCKNCGKEFTQFSSLQKTCSVKCTKELEKAKKKKEKEKKKESIPSLKKDLWTIVSEYIRRKYADKD